MGNESAIDGSDPNHIPLRGFRGSDTGRGVGDAKVREATNGAPESWASARLLPLRLRAGRTTSRAKCKILSLSASPPSP
jgi:hypothetical protein